MITQRILELVAISIGGLVTAMILVIVRKMPIREWDQSLSVHFGETSGRKSGGGVKTTVETTEGR